jgi:hypothetical protein
MSAEQQQGISLLWREIYKTGWLASRYLCVQYNFPVSQNKAIATSVIAAYCVREGVQFARAPQISSGSNDEEKMHRNSTVKFDT